MQVTCVTFDCHEPRRVAEFWNAALRWRGVDELDDGDIAVCRPDEGGNFLEFVRVPEQKSLKNRVHLGCSAGDLAAMDDELGRLVDLGATVAWEERFPAEVASHYRNVVLRDVEGNEFCLGAGNHPG